MRMLKDYYRTRGAPSAAPTHSMRKPFPLHPKHPERICWGCDKYCAVNAMGCGNGSSRTQHPAELLGDDWYEHGDWGIEVETRATPSTSAQ